MDENWLRHLLTPAEAAAFEQDGYLVVPDALTPAQVQGLTAAVEQLVSRRHSDSKV